MFEASVLKELGLPRTSVLHCVSVKKLHGTVNRAVFTHTKKIFA